jgi:hypothetical protein
MPALKRMIKLKTLPEALKRFFPRINAGPPTRATKQLIRLLVDAKPCA